MILTLVRVKSAPQYTVGKLFIDGKFECFTLEDPFRKKKIQGQTRIPDGSYGVKLRFSPKFSPSYNHELLWLMDVPEFEYILIHIGNTVDDTRGCILVGTSEKAGVLYESKKAYNSLYSKVSSETNNLFLTIVSL